MTDDFIRRPEFLAHIDPMREDIREVRDDVKTLLVASNMQQGVEVEKKTSDARIGLRSNIVITAVAIASLVLSIVAVHPAWA